MNKFKILILDDIYENVYALKLLLEDSFLDIEIFEATCVKDALVTIIKNEIDLILSDVQMPEVDGFQFVEYLQEVESTKHIPIILITGIYNTSEYQKKAYSLSSNVVDFISKPVNEEILCSKLKIFINLFSQKKQIVFSQEEKIDKMMNKLETKYRKTLIEDDDLVDLQELIEKNVKND